jgi:hypothetical protein
MMAPLTASDSKNRDLPRAAASPIERAMSPHETPRLA